MSRDVVGDEDRFEELFLAACAVGGEGTATGVVRLLRSAVGSGVARSICDTCGCYRSR